MILTELHLKNFGCFMDERILLKEGMNLFYGENEKGKSTLHAFMKGMLFGIERQRGKASKNDIYSTYEPWDHPAFYAGVLKFESGGKIFRIERSFHRSQRENRLICETDGEELSIVHGDLEVLLGGLKTNSFDNTMSMRQLKSMTDKSLASDLKNYAANYHKSGDFELDIAEALERLKEEKKTWQKRMKMEQEEQQRNREQIRTKIDFIQAELEQGMENLHELQEKEAALKLMQESHDSQELQSEDEKEVKRPFSIISGIVAAIVFSIAVFLLIPIIWLDSLLSAGCFGVILFCYFYFTSPIEEAEMIAEQSSDLAFQRVKWELQRVKEELKERHMTIDNLEETLAELSEVNSKVIAAEQEIAALEMAGGVIGRLSQDIRSEQGGLLNQRASAILEKITAGRYQQVVVDDDLNIRINTPDKLLELRQVSRGTIEQIYFAIRMAAAELLFPEEPMPIILDETFAFYDEARAAQALKWLSENKKQVLLFTCQRREEEILKNLGISYHCPW